MVWELSLWAGLYQGDKGNSRACRLIEGEERRRVRRAADENSVDCRRGTYRLRKTGLAVQLALRLGGEVISADSMQLYREIPIQTAQPDEEERGGIPHYLMGILPLTASYSVARWLSGGPPVDRGNRSAGKNTHRMWRNGAVYQFFAAKSSLIGTGRASGGSPPPAGTGEKKEGAGTLLHDLEMVDPSTAPLLHPRDLHRVIRALELYETTGMTMSEQIRASGRSPLPMTPRSCCWIAGTGPFYMAVLMRGWRPCWKPEWSRRCGAS